MATSEFNVRDILVGRAPAGAPVTVKGWVRTRRDSKAGLSFVHLSDGSSLHPLQVVAPNTLPNYTDDVLRLTAGCAVEATGAIVPSPAKGQPFEMQASAIKVVGWVEDPDTYPISRSRTRWNFYAKSRICGHAPRDCGGDAGAAHAGAGNQPVLRPGAFFWVNTPIITASDAEGAGALFCVSTLDLANLPRTPQGEVDFAKDFFGREAFLTVSGQLNVEAYCSHSPRCTRSARRSAPRIRTPAATSPSSG